MTIKTKSIIVSFTALVIVCICGCEEEAKTVSKAPSRIIETASSAKPQAENSVAKPPKKDIQEPADELTLRNALALTLVHNPQLKAFSWEIRISEADKLQASLRPNPELGFEAEGIGVSGETETTLALSQLIEMGDKRRKRMRFASVGRELAAMDYEARRLDILTQVDKSFIDVLAAQRGAELAGQLVVLSEQVLDTVTTRVEAGKDSPIEQTRSEIALANSRIEHTQAKQNLIASRKTLASFWGSEQPVFEKAVGAFDEVKPVPSADALAELIGNNPDLARWAVEIEQRRAAFQLEKARGKQDITVSGGVKYLDETGDSGMVVGVSIPIPFFNSNQGGRLRAINRLAQASEQQRAAEIRINVALTMAHLSLSNAYTTTTELKNNVLQKAQTLFDAAQEGYEYGKFDYLDLLAAQQTGFEARRRYLDSLADCHKARADVERLIGQSVDNPDNIGETQKESAKILQGGN